MSKIYKVKWTSNAKEDLLNIVDYIKKDSLSAARKVYGQIKEKAQSSNFFPLRGRVVPELLKEGITIYRELIVQPWRIIYKIENVNRFIDLLKEYDIKLNSLILVYLNFVLEKDLLE